MDPTTITQTVNAFLALLELAKSAIEMIPDPVKKMEALAEYQKAELQFQTAEANLAKEFGYPLCHAHFPPGIMVQVNRHTYQCQICGRGEEWPDGYPLAN